MVLSINYYWLRFRTATAQTGLCFFLYRHHLMQLSNQYWGMHCWCRIETNKVFWMYLCSCMSLWSFIFEQQQLVASLLLLALDDAIPRKKPYNRSSFRFISWHTQVCFPSSCIKAWYNPESLFCEQRIVSRFVFLAMVRIHGQVPRCDLLCFNYAEISTI